MKQPKRTEQASQKSYPVAFTVSVDEGTSRRLSELRSTALAHGRISRAQAVRMLIDIGLDAFERSRNGKVHA